MFYRKLVREKLENALEEYSKATALIRELTEQTGADYPSFTFEIAMRNFDWMLQAILLRTAVEDGCFLEEEQVFIEKITDYGDLMAHLNEQAKNNKQSVYLDDWNALNLLSAADRTALSKQILKELDRSSQAFFEPLGVIDGRTEKDYWEELALHLQRICALLAACDGDSQSSESFCEEKTIYLSLIDQIKERWNQYKKQA